MGRWGLGRAFGAGTRRAAGAAAVLVLAGAYVASRHPSMAALGWLRALVDQALAWLPVAATGFQEHPFAWLSLGLAVLLRRQLRALLDAIASAVPERAFKLEIKGVQFDLGEPRALDSLAPDAQTLPSVSSRDEPAITETVVLTESAAQIQFELRPQPPASPEKRAAATAADAAFDELGKATHTDAEVVGWLEQFARHLMDAGFFRGDRLALLTEADARLNRLVQEARLRAEAKPSKSSVGDDLILLAVGCGWAEASAWKKGLALLKPLVERPAPFLPAGPAFLACAYNDLVQRQVVDSSGDSRSDEFLKQLDAEVLAPIARLDQAAQTFDVAVWSTALGVGKPSAIGVRRALWQIPGIIQTLLAQNTADPAASQALERQSRERIERAAQTIDGVEPDGIVLCILAALQSYAGDHEAAHRTLDRIPAEFRDPIAIRTRMHVLFTQRRPLQAFDALRLYPTEWADRPGTARELVDLLFFAADRALDWDALSAPLRRAMALDFLWKARAFASTPERQAWFVENPTELARVEELLGNLSLQEPGEEARAAEAFERLESLAAQAPPRNAPLPERLCEWQARHARACVRLARHERLLLSPHAAERALEGARGRCRALLGLLGTLPLTATDPALRRRRRFLARVHAIEALLELGGEAVAQQRLEWAAEALRTGALELLAAVRGALVSYPELKHLEPDENDGRLESFLKHFEARQALLDARLAIAEDPDGRQAATKDLVVQRCQRALGNDPRLDATARLELARFLLVLALRGRPDGMACLRDAREALERAAQADEPGVRAEALRLLAHAWSAGPTVERRQKRPANAA